jgi:hypothetical protein
MRFISSLATLTAAVSATAIRRDAAGLDIQLTAEGNTIVKAVITNKNPLAVELLNKGTILDAGHVEKVSVSSQGKFAFASLIGPSRSVPTSLYFRPNSTLSMVDHST